MKFSICENSINIKNKIFKFVLHLSKIDINYTFQNNIGTSQMDDDEVVTYLTK
jgi:hypothetical protein